MVKNVTMVMSNKTLSRGTQLAQIQCYEKKYKKIKSKITVSLTLSKLKGEFIT